MRATLTWEEAVLWLRAQEDKQALVRSCYYDDPLVEAAQRFQVSEEWQATRALLRKHLPGQVLDLGAGRGVASYAFAREGCQVVALEPDPSAVVGRGAIANLAAQTGLKIRPAAGFGEAMPFPETSFDVVYGRAVLHHAGNLSALCREVARVLRPGGAVLWVREHVISRPEDLPAFLNSHPLHALYGGEMAYRLEEYCEAIHEAGLRLVQLLGPLENAVNYYPATGPTVQQVIFDKLALRLGEALASLVLTLPGCRWLITRWLSRRNDTPGRHYAFLGVKP